MNIPTPDDSGRGQVGIGTLIIFIALVLVAAVAAGVLIDTSGQLESRASDTGADAQAEVSNQVEVVSATGIDNTNDNQTVETVELVVKKSAGSDPIDLSAATIEYTSSDSSATLVKGDTANATAFSTTAKAGGNSEVLESTSQRVEITVDTAAIEDNGGLSAGDDADLEIVDQSGASTIYGVNIDPVFTGNYVSV